MADNLLEVVDIHCRFRVGRGTVYAVNGVSFTVERGRTLALVGESGSGKTTLAKCILMVYRPQQGRVIFRGEEVTSMKPRAMKDFRKRVQYVFQDPLSSLNPRMTVFQNVARGMIIHGLASGSSLRAKVGNLLEMVSLSRDHLDRFPNEFSGGQRQRIAIARALAVQPELVILDEPTSSLDVSVQAQILNMLMNLQSEQGYSYIFITHNLVVARHISDRVAVMYFGDLVELADVSQVFERPAHPYTSLLLSSVPWIDGRSKRRTAPRSAASGSCSPMAGCRFYPRCDGARPLCRSEKPALAEIQTNHYVACHFPLL